MTAYKEIVDYQGCKVHSEYSRPEDTDNHQESFVKKSPWYHLYTIWLFTANDIKSIVLPETAFGVFTALSGASLTTNPHVQIQEVALRVPRVLAWNWINLLLFDVANQRLTHSVLEDSINKPWRPLPSGRINEAQARRLLLFIVPVCFCSSAYLGGLLESVALMVLTWMYNDLGGSDEHYNIRNFINALGFMCYSSGSAAVAVGPGSHTLNRRAYEWIAIVGAIIFSTLSLQDMPDIPGDRLKGRRTLPLKQGEYRARWLIGMPVLAWSISVPTYWKLYNEERLAYMFVITVGVALTFRIILLGGVAADKISWKLWCVWTMVLYAVPLAKNHQNIWWQIAIA